MRDFLTGCFDLMTHSGRTLHHAAASGQLLRLLAASMPAYHLETTLLHQQV
jgi:hypothetical protein